MNIKSEGKHTKLHPSLHLRQSYIESIPTLTIVHVLLHRQFKTHCFSVTCVLNVVSWFIDFSTRNIQLLSPILLSSRWSSNILINMHQIYMCSESFRPSPVPRLLCSGTWIVGRAWYLFSCECDIIKRGQLQQDFRAERQHFTRRSSNYTPICQCVGYLRLAS